MANREPIPSAHVTAEERQPKSNPVRYSRPRLLHGSGESIGDTCRAEPGRSSCICGSGDTVSTLDADIALRALSVLSSQLEGSSVVVKDLERPRAVPCEEGPSGDDPPNSWLYEGGSSGGAVDGPSNRGDVGAVITDGPSAAANVRLRDICGDRWDCAWRVVTLAACTHERR